MLLLVHCVLNLLCDQPFQYVKYDASTNLQTFIYHVKIVLLLPLLVHNLPHIYTISFRKLFTAFFWLSTICSVRVKFPIVLFINFNSPFQYLRISDLFGSTFLKPPPCLHVQFIFLVSFSCITILLSQFSSSYMKRLSIKHHHLLLLYNPLAFWKISFAVLMLLLISL